MNNSLIIAVGGLGLSLVCLFSCSRKDARTALGVADVAVAVTSAEGEGSKQRSCQARYRFVAQAAGGAKREGEFAAFSARRGCGVPDRCRRRARDSASACMIEHWKTREKSVLPGACKPDSSVLEYVIADSDRKVPEGDITTRLEVEVCCALDSTAKDVGVAIKGSVNGGRGCDASIDLDLFYRIESCAEVREQHCP